jgi:indole-3-glycerol phosphate synthase
MILDRIVASKRLAHAARRPASLDVLIRDALTSARPRSLARAIENPERGWPRVIAEFKRRSPSAGLLSVADVAEVAAGYARNGARAMSVLTDDEFFGGALADLAAAKGAIPILRKDFLLDERDVVESRLAGADAVLLIVRILEEENLRRLIVLAGELGMDALVEAHTSAEIDRAVAAGATIVGVNHRDLDTLQIDLGLSAGARDQVGADRILVAESGIRDRADVERMCAVEVDAILVGEVLLRTKDPGAKLGELACS